MVLLELYKGVRVTETLLERRSLDLEFLQFLENFTSFFKLREYWILVVWEQILTWFPGIVKIPPGELLFTPAGN